MVFATNKEGGGGSRTDHNLLSGSVLSRGVLRGKKKYFGGIIGQLSVLDLMNYFPLPGDFKQNLFPPAKSGS